MDSRLVVGRVSGVFGTRGWLKVQSYTRPRENLLGYKPWSLLYDGQWREFELAEGRRHHGGLIVLLSGFTEREQAATMVRCDIAVPRSELPGAPPGEYYWADLIGLKVANASGDALGEVTGLIETNAHDVLRVSGERERLIPFVTAVYVLEVDLDGGLIQVDWHKDD